MRITRTSFQEIATEILSLNEFVLNNLTVNLNGRIYNFGKDICIRTTLCPLSNTIVQFFFNAFWNEKVGVYVVIVFSENKIYTYYCKNIIFYLQLWDDPRVRLDYPFLYFFENKFFLPLHLYGVELGGAKGIESIEMIHLHYPIPSTDHASSAYYY